MMSDLRKRGQDFEAFGARIVVDLYRRINDALAKHEGAVEAYLKAVGPLLDWIEQGTPHGWLIHGGGPPASRKKRAEELPR